MTILLMGGFGKSLPAINKYTSCSIKNITSINFTARTDIEQSDHVSRIIISKLHTEMDLTQHPPEPAATSAKRLRRAPTATATSNNNRPSRGILKHSPSWLDTEKAENRSPNISCRTKNLSTLSSFSQYFDRQVAQDIVNSYKRPATIATHEEQMETCRLMIYDLNQFSTLLLDEKHDTSLAVEGYTLALTVVHLQTKLHDNLGIIRFPPEELFTEMITYKLNTAKLLQRMHEARGKYGTYDRALDEAYRTTCSSTSTYSHTHQF